MKIYKIRPGRAVMSFLLIFGVTVFGFSGVGGAQSMQGTIEHTGPGSDNTITITNENTCEISNENNIEIDNKTEQQATTGDVNVSGNTTVSGWGAWDPVAWQNNGYTYAQWQAAFSAYLSANQAGWQANWGSLSGGGTAHSGNASNSNTTTVGIHIDNGGAAGAGSMCGAAGQNGTNNPGSSNTHHDPAVLGASTGSGGGSGVGFSGFFNGNGSGGSFGLSGGQGGSGSSGSSNNPNNPGSGGFRCDGSISMTGPDSDNAINCSSSNSLTVTNTNYVNNNNYTDQEASTGEVNVSQNTSSGGGGSGDAGNTNDTTFNFSVQN